MNYHNITTDDMLNGDGLRVVLWVAGCEHHCDGCQNPITWNYNGGIPFDQKAWGEICDELNKDYIDGITLSGGDPLHPENRLVCMWIAAMVKELYDNKTVWLYTGYDWEDIKDINGIKFVDVIVDGKFEKDRADISYEWAGSRNQRVIDVKKSLEMNCAIRYSGR